MGSYVDELEGLVPEDIAPAINHLTEKFLKEFHRSAAQPLCASALHDRRLDKKQRLQLLRLVKPLSISHFKFLGAVLREPKPVVLLAFRYVWIIRTRLALCFLFKDLLEVGYVNHAILPRTPPAWAREIAMKILDNRKIYFSSWIRAVCEDTFYAFQRRVGKPQNSFS